jgi:hypothetical protein
LTAFAEFRRRGTRRVALNVDAASRIGAARLYEVAGMTAVQEYALYQKMLRREVMPANRP